MTTCDEVDERLGALLDGEVTGAERHGIETHVGACGRCRTVRDELVQLRAALHEVYAATLATAPPVPAALRPARRLLRLAGVLAGAATMLLLVVVFVMLPGRRLDASPLATLRRAASAYERLHDVELWVSAESEAFSLIEQLVSEDGASEGPSSGVTRVLMNARGHLLIQKLGDPRQGLADDRPLQGWDGTLSWSYDPTEGAVHVTRTPPFQITISGEPGQHAKDLGLMRFLSWDFVRELADRSSDSLAIEERTGPSDERAGRRVMRVAPRPDAAGDESTVKKLLWARADVTIDVASDRIEKLIVDLSFAGLSLLRFKGEVARFDPHLPQSAFGYRAHVPAGTPVIEDHER